MFWRDEPPPKRSSVLWAGSEVWDLYLDTASNGLARLGQAPTWEAHATPAQGASAGMKRLRAQARGWASPRVRVWLSGALAKPFVLTPVTGLKGKLEAQAMAQAMVREATGLEPGCDVCLDSVPKSAPALSVAIPSDLGQEIAGTAKALRVTIKSLRPWWAGALGEALASDARLELFAAQDTEAVTVLVAKENVWLSANTYTPNPNGAQLEALVTRRLFADGVETKAACRVRLDATLGNPSFWPKCRPLTSFADE